MPNVRTNPRSKFSFNVALGRYIDPRTGRFVRHERIRRELDTVLVAAQNEVEALADALRGGRLSLAEWQTAMATQIKTIHLVSVAAARGGWAALTPADYGRAGAALRKQYEFLQNFSQQIESGAQRIDGSLNVRAAMYAQSGRATYEDTRRAAMQAQGNTEERRSLGRAEHCDDCIAAAGRGWQPIGTLPRIGDSVCRTNCKCTFDYR